MCSFLAALGLLVYCRRREQTAASGQGKPVCPQKARPVKEPTRVGRGLSKKARSHHRNGKPEARLAPSDRRVRDWQRLRAWEKRPHTIRRRDCYKATSLLSGINEGRLRVTILPALLKYLAKHPPTNYKGEPGRPKHRHGFLASLVMLACLTRRAPAVLGKLDDFGDLMGVSRRTAWSDLEYLCSVTPSSSASLASVRSCAAMFQCPLSGLVGCNRSQLWARRGSHRTSPATQLVRAGARAENDLAGL